MGHDQELKWLAFSLYPLSFFLNSPFKYSQWFRCFRFQVFFRFHFYPLTEANSESFEHKKIVNVVLFVRDFYTNFTPLPRNSWIRLWFNVMLDCYGKIYLNIVAQVMKTNHAPENLIPSAKPLSRDLARQILPDDMQVLLYTHSLSPIRYYQTTCRYFYTPTPSLSHQILPDDMQVLLYTHSLSHQILPDDMEVL